MSPFVWFILAALGLWFVIAFVLAFGVGRAIDIAEREQAAAREAAMRRHPSTR